MSILPDVSGLRLPLIVAPMLRISDLRMTSPCTS